MVAKVVVFTTRLRLIEPGDHEVKLVEGLSPTVHAFEDVCDQYTGAAYGLCVAFCEAKDCDAAWHESCQKLKDNLFKKTGDASFPCEVSCPCWGANDLALITSTGSSGRSCEPILRGGYSQISAHGDTYTFHAKMVGDCSRPEFCESIECYFFNDITGTDFSVGRPEMTVEESQVCYQQIYDRCAEVA